MADEMYNRIKAVLDEALKGFIGQQQVTDEIIDEIKATMMQFIVEPSDRRYEIVDHLQFKLMPDNPRTAIPANGYTAIVMACMSTGDKLPMPYDVKVDTDCYGETHEYSGLRGFYRWTGGDRVYFMPLKPMDFIEVNFTIKDTNEGNTNPPAGPPPA